MKGYANAHLLVTPEELSSMIGGSGAKPPLVLDLRPPEAYTAGHVPGAIHIDLWGVSLIDSDPAPLHAFMWMIEHVLAVHGVSESTPVVVYDEQSGIRAARAFWFLEYFGHPSVRLLDGGFNAWAAAGYEITRDAAPVRQSDWTGTRHQETIATWRDVRSALGRPESVILDTRSDGEYCGSVARAKRGGAIPGAVHIEWTRNLNADGRFKPSAEPTDCLYAVGGGDTLSCTVSGATAGATFAPTTAEVLLATHTMSMPACAPVTVGITLANGSVAGGRDDWC